MTNAPAQTLDLSPQEAEAVLELWAKKQAEGELRSRLNVQDLAEAMSLPVEEVEKMVDSVRQKASAPTFTPSLKRAKPVNRPLIALAVLAWFTILGAACFLTYEMGLKNGRTMVGFPAAAPPPLMETTVAPAGVPDMATDIAVATPTAISGIPRSVRVEIKGYKVIGESRQNDSEARILSSLQQIVGEVTAPANAAIELVHSDLAIVNALQANDSAKVDGQIQFIPMSVTSRSGSMIQMIPIPVVNEAQLVKLVKAEQLSRLKILANWAFNKRGETPLDSK